LRYFFFTTILGLLYIAPTAPWIGPAINSSSVAATPAPAKWQSIALPFRPTYVTSVENVFWVGGTDEMLAESQDQGRTWQVRHQKADGEVVLHVGFLNKQTGYATGSNGLLLWTRDSGKTWTSNGSDPNSMRDVYFADQQHGLRETISGVDITHDGGSSWAPVSILKSDKDLRSAKLIFGLAVLDADRAAILVKDGPYSGQVIVYTVDGGETWNKTDIPHSGIRRLVAHDGEYWVFGHEVIDRERGDGGYGVALAAHSRDGLNWVHGARSPNEYSNCNSQGCIIHDGAIVELYGEKPLLTALPADGTLTPKWAMAGNVVCTVGSGLRCADARPSETVPPAPEIDRPISQSTGTREPAIGCLVCDLEPFPAPKSRVGKNVLELNFIVHKDGTVGDVRVKGAPARDVEISVERVVGSWVFEPPRQNGQALEETRKVRLGISCGSFPSNEEATCSFTVIPVAGG
jgi:photosynthesis system II assembly factor YCF48-like protein